MACGFPPPFIIIYIPIWLYSNEYPLLMPSCPHFLHSNLVIFKFSIFLNLLSLTKFYIPIWLYSNDFTLLKNLAFLYLLHSNLVIFKCFSETHEYHIKNFYIPIWLYSNQNYSSERL